MIETPVYCQKCKRYLFTAKGTTIIDELPCHSCKHKNQIKIITKDSSDIDRNCKFIKENKK